MQTEKAEEKKKEYQDILILINKNKLIDAQTKLAGFQKKFPEDPEFFNLKALIETLQKNNAAAEQSYLKAITLDKSNLLSHLGLSKLALDTGNLTKAKEYADKTLSLNDKVINAYLLLADIAYKQKNNSEVETVLSTAYEKVKGNMTSEIEVIKSLGKFYAVQKQPEKVLSLAEDLVKRYPEESKAQSVLAGAQIVNDKKSLAIETLQKLISKESKDVNHRLLLAKLLSENPEQEKEAIKLMDETLAIEPENPQVYMFKTAYLTKIKRFPEAMELANRTDKKFPDLFVGKILIGDVYLAEKKLDKALENYQQAYKKQPNNKLLFTITDILATQNKLTEAISLLEKESTKNPKNIALSFKLGTLYNMQKDYKAAKKQYILVLEADPNNTLALNNLAWLYSLEKDPKALEFAKQAYTNAPESPAIADTYGVILIQHGQAKDGLNVLEKAAADAPKLDDIQFHLAQAYLANDKNSNAIEVLEKLVKPEKNFPEKKAAVELLEKLKK